MLDTNPLIDWLLERNQQRATLVERLLAKSPELQVTDMVILEVVFVLETHYDFSRKQITANIQTILSTANLNCNRQLFARALEDYCRRPALSFVDCCLVHYARLQNALPLWTFDKKLAAQSGGTAQLLK